MNRVKAIAMFSGGLDSTLAVKLMLDQGIQVEALSFTSPFCLCEGKGGCITTATANKLGVPMKKILVDEEYLRVIRDPKHGYGRFMNPCIDCRIYMLKKAKEYADRVGAHFIFTGEVLGERPMSQRREALETIEKEAGLSGRILRPLSAKYLPETEGCIPPLCSAGMLRLPYQRGQLFVHLPGYVRFLYSGPWTDHSHERGRKD